MEKVRLGDVLIYEQPTKYIVESDQYNDSFKTPVLTAGKSFLLGYTNEKTGIFDNLPVIIFDDFTTAFKFVDFPFKVKSSAMKILKADEKKADINYLFYKMMTIKTDNGQHKRYWISKFANIQIPLPSLAEQKAIAEKLDKAQEIIRYNEEIIANYNALTQSLFIDMFGDITSNVKFKIGTIKDLVDIVRDGPHVSPSYSDTGFPILSTRNIRPFTLIMDDVKFVSEQTFESLTKKFKPAKGDVLLTKGGTTGFAKIVDWNWDFCIWVHLAILRVKDCVNPKFLESALNSYYCYNQSQEKTRGIANKDLGLTRIVDIKLPIPPIALQNQFAEHIAVIEAQKELAQESLVKSQELFQSLLQESFED